MAMIEFFNNEQQTRRDREHLSRCYESRLTCM